jgi:selenide, water dikinase
LCHLPKQSSVHSNVLVGLDVPDDAGVYKINEDTALVQTVDYFTPIVDDPYLFGQIAAANALSDVYAMGGRPITVLNIVGFPIKKLDPSILASILKGASDKVVEAGAVIIGGHSIDDQEPKFGMAVTGLVHPEQIWTNHGAQPGDAIILTKPIGVGIQTTGIKRDLLTETEIDKVSAVMAALNKKAAEIAARYTIHASTDITGFGLLGHLKEMAEGSGTGITLYADQVPVLERTKELAQAGSVPGGTKSNYEWLQPSVHYPESMDLVDQWILCDAITSGGLALSVPQKEAGSLIADLHTAGITDAAIIASVTDEQPGKIVVR